MPAKMRSDVEDTGTNNTKVSDSGYSCSNSQSQRSTGSSKSRNSTSSGSSGYGGHISNINATSSEDGSSKKKEHKKKKNKTGGCGTACSSTGGGDVTSLVVLSPAENGCIAPSTASCLAPAVVGPSTVAIEPAPPSAIVDPTQLMETQEEAQSGRHPTQVQQENGHAINVEALQMAALSHTLSSLKKMKTRETPDESDCSPGQDIDPDEIAYLLKSELSHEGEAVLNIVVSLSDGSVVYTSGLTQVLGYPKEMWLGRSLIDFIQPKHRATFAGNITSAIADFKPTGGPPSNKNVFYCCLRTYRGLKTLGFNVAEKRVTYLPCQFVLNFKEFPSVSETGTLKECLVITAVPVRSAYKYPDEKRISPKFMTRHSATCQLIHVDPEVVSYFGYLPQDMLNRSILDFYHPQDLHFLKEVYEAVIKEPGHPFRSKPYRFRCQNGGYSLVETELSSFNNPWSRKLEFIIGQHCILKGPTNPDVMTPCEPETLCLKISEDLLKETKILQEEIKGLLNETLVKTPETAKQQVSKRCKDLAVFMEHLMDEIVKPPDLKVVVPTEEQSFSERDSVMLGEISPHHDYYDSKSSSETPPSYNQLNYNENIHRFFESQPKTSMCDDSGDSKNGSGGEENKVSPVAISSSDSKSGGSGVSSGQSTESTGNSGDTTSNNTPSNNMTQSYKPHALTEHLLSRHNEDMEKQMVQKHREQRTKSDRDSKVKDRLKPYDKGAFNDDCATHGVKRCGSHSLEGDINHKSIKASHTNTPGGPTVNQTSGGNGNNVGQPGTGSLTTAFGPSSSSANVFGFIKTEGQGVLGNSSQTLVAPPSSDLMAKSSPPNAQPKPSLWPPFSVSLTPVQSSAQEYSASGIASALMPMYYLPNPRQHSTETANASSAFHSNHSPSGLTAPYLPQQVQYMPSMLYHPVLFGTTSMVYSPLTMYPPVFQQSGEGPSTAQPGPGPQEEIKSDPEKKSNGIEGDSNGTSVTFDDSSYHSSFYSFLKTDKSDESMRSSSENEKHEGNRWGSSQGSRKGAPIRKEAPWVEALNVGPHLEFQYRLKVREDELVLKQDMNTLKQFIQPSLVDDQLSQMCHELELSGLPKQLCLEESATSSSESSGDDTNVGNNKKRRVMDYDIISILFEEDAPMPPPHLSAACT